MKTIYIPAERNELPPINKKVLVAYRDGTLRIDHRYKLSNDQMKASHNWWYGTDLKQYSHWLKPIKITDDLYEKLVSKAYRSLPASDEGKEGVREELILISNNFIHKPELSVYNNNIYEHKYLNYYLRQVCDENYNTYDYYLVENNLDIFIGSSQNGDLDSEKIKLDFKKQYT